MCEGATDAVLLSYYLGKVAGWKYCRAPKNLNIKVDNKNECVNWYSRGAEYLLICGVGGKDNFGHFYHEKIEKPLLVSDAFQKIAIVTDRDNHAISEIENSMKYIADPIRIMIKNGEWTKNQYLDSFGIEKALDFLLVIVPTEHQGALETMMLDAISENEYDRNIVKRAGEFLNHMRSEASKYIVSDRLQLKAHLGVTWAIQYPEKIFSLIDEQIRSVQWENSEILRKCFAKLEEM